MNNNSGEVNERLMAELLQVYKSQLDNSLPFHKFEQYLSHQIPISDALKQTLTKIAELNFLLEVEKGKQRVLTEKISQ